MKRRILLGTGLLAAAALVLSLLPIAQASRGTTDNGQSAIVSCSVKGCTCGDCKCGTDCQCAKARCTCCKDCKCGTDCGCCKEGKSASACKCGDGCKGGDCGKASAARLGAGCKHDKPASQCS